MYVKFFWFYYMYGEPLFFLYFLDIVSISCPQATIEGEKNDEPAMPFGTTLRHLFVGN